MKTQLLSALLISSLVLNGCEENKQDNSVPDFMPAQKYKGQGYDPNKDEESKNYKPVTNEEKKFLQQHKKYYKNLAKKFFEQNFGLDVEVTNILPLSGYQVQAYIHCNDRDIVFESSLTMDKQDLSNENEVLKISKNSDEMSNIVSTVISGFEYRAQKDKYDNLYNYFKKNTHRFNYTGFTKEAIYKTKRAGYQNQYFNITGYPVSLEDYHNNYEPLINMKRRQFTRKMNALNKEENDSQNAKITTTLFSTNENYTPKNNVKNIFKIENDLKSSKNTLPKNIVLSLEFNKNKINTSQPYWYKQNPTSYEISNFN